jgi:DNA-binding MarR family transcriptional regulator
MESCGMAGKNASESDPKGHAWARFFVTSALLVDRVESALKAAALPPLAWYDLLWILENADGGRMRMHDLAARVVLSRYNVTRLADRMEEEGVIRRERCEQDRRGAYCVLTPAGRALRRRMWPVYRAEVDACFGAQLSVGEARALGAMLEKVQRGLGAKTGGRRRALEQP